MDLEETPTETTSSAHLSTGCHRPDGNLSLTFGCWLPFEEEIASKSLATLIEFSDLRESIAHQPPLSKIDVISETMCVPTLRDEQSQQRSRSPQGRLPIQKNSSLQESRNNED